MGLFSRKPALRVPEDTHAFCSGCGERMEWRRAQGGFDPQTGKRHQWDVWECPNLGQKISDGFGWTHRMHDRGSVYPQNGEWRDVA